MSGDGRMVSHGGGDELREVGAVEVEGEASLEVSEDEGDFRSSAIAALRC